MRERGQATVEYLGLVVVVAALLALGGAAVLAVGRSSVRHRDETPPNAGVDLALARAHAPAIVFERGIRDAPVDPRTCRDTACATGARPVLFAHVVHRGATTYIQYWAYWADSSWHGIAGRHADDWESFQVRINADGTVDARASAHHGYTGGRVGPDLNVNQIHPAWVPRRWRRGWTRDRGGYVVARHSHAGFVAAPAGGRPPTVLPLEPGTMPQDYAITPPWRKAVYADPESTAT